MSNDSLIPAETRGGLVLATPIAPKAKCARPQCLVALLVTLSLVTSTGCLSINTETLRKVAYLNQLGSGLPVSVRKTPKNPLESQLNLLGWSGPKPSERTVLLLRRYNLDELYNDDPDDAYRQLQTVVETDPTLATMAALAEVAYVLGHRASSHDHHSDAMGYYSDCLTTSYDYLFNDRFINQRNEFDPEFRTVSDLYNMSLEGILRQLDSEGFLQVNHHSTLTLHGRQTDLQIVSKGNWNAADIEGFKFVSDFQVKGLNNTHHTYGLGVPLIGIRVQREQKFGEEKYYPSGLTIPVTAFFRVIPAGQFGYGAANKPHVVIELHDPLETSQVSVGGEAAPLESDISTPLAYFLNDPVIGTKTIATFALLDADFGKNFRGLHMLQPYDPEKIPVVMVHGLWDSPITWMEMFNDLRAMPDIRERYQFWFYMYPTGQPFWLSAEQMREDLAQIRKDLDPQQRSAAFDQMVLVGHSMGGLVSRLQTIESADHFWNLISERPLEELEMDEETKQQIQQVWYFDPDPSIKRVVTIGTPHQGSKFANDATRWLGRNLFALPQMVTQAKETLFRENPDYFFNRRLLTTATSIDSLSPESPYWTAMASAEKAPWVKYHNIVGNVPRKNFLAFLGSKFSGEGDGIVPLESSRVTDAESEIEVAADHTHLHQHPLAILEIRRILRQHLAEVDSGIRQDPNIQHVEFQGAPQTNDSPTTNLPVETPPPADSNNEPRIAQLPPVEADPPPTETQPDTAAPIPAKPRRFQLTDDSDPQKQTTTPAEAPPTEDAPADAPPTDNEPAPAANATTTTGTPDNGAPVEDSTLAEGTAPAEDTAVGEDTAVVEDAAPAETTPPVSQPQPAGN